MLCVQGQATDIAIQAEEILKLKRQINQIYAKHTGQPLETIGRFAQLFIYNPLVEEKKHVFLCNKKKSTAEFLFKAALIYY